MFWRDFRKISAKNLKVDLLFPPMYVLFIDNGFCLSHVLPLPDVWPSSLHHSILVDNPESGHHLLGWNKWSELLVAAFMQNYDFNSNRETVGDMGVSA
jgi:hypothetical protein